jgi:N utilization substance protein B
MSRVPVRRLGRERAVQALFSLETAAPEEVPAGLTRFWASVEGDTPDEARSFADELVGGVVARRAEVDEKIQTQSTTWRVDRMARVDRNVLRVGAYELLFTETPARVVINEAIEVARAYGSEESAAFVNGLLDRVARAAGRI